MIGFGSLAEKSAAALEKAKRDLERIESDVARHETERPDGSDLDALVDWKRRKADLEIQREAAEEACEFATGAAERQAAAAVEAEKDRRHSAAQKLAGGPHAKLIVEICADMENLKAKLAKAEEMRANIEAANAVRESRPAIVDGERRVREVPAQVIPASTRKEMAWINADGERPNQLRDNGKGQLVPAETGHGPSGPFAYREVEVVQSPEQHIPSRMPQRLADAVKLVGLKGERLFG